MENSKLTAGEVFDINFGPNGRRELDLVQDPKETSIPNASPLSASVATRIRRFRLLYPTSSQDRGGVLPAKQEKP